MADSLIGSLDTEAKQRVKEAWRVEIERRAQELDCGAVQSIPWEVVRLARSPATQKPKSDEP